MISICDSLSADYPTAQALAASLVGALNIEMRQRGWTGARILNAEYFADDTPPRLLIVIGPGHRALTVEAVSAYLKDRRRRSQGKAP